MLRSQGATVSVRVGGQSGCSACDQGKGCGAGIFGKLLRRKPVVLEVANAIGAGEGQAVMLAISETLFLRMVMRLYGWPLLAGLAGAAVAQWLAARSGVGTGIADIATLVTALGAVASVLIFRARATTPDISAGDIRLLESKAARVACEAGREP